MLLELFFMTCSFIVLYKSSNYLVDFSTKIAAYFDLPEFVIGFVIVAIGTSLPELSVSTTSSIMGIPDISVGNVIGSNIVNITLVLGIAALIYQRIRIESEILFKDMIFSVFLSVFPFFLTLALPFHPIIGVFLITMFLLYLFRITGEKKFRKEVEVRTKEAVIAGALIVPAIILVIFSSYLITYFGQEIASLFSVSSFMVGMTIVALGTSLPELSTILVSLKKGYSYLAWGNLMGSLVANSTLVLGTTTMFATHAFTGKGLLPAVGLLFLLQTVLLIISQMDREIRRTDGISFILLYAFYVILEFLINA